MCLHAQLFWPDDKMWYLVEIHSVIPKLRTAKCASSPLPPCLPLATQSQTWQPTCVGPARLKQACTKLVQNEPRKHTGRCACRIQYTSGEIEELDLEEIIREGHMSLITQ